MSVSQIPPMNWIDIGEPPAEIEAWRAARIKRLLPIGSVLGGAFVGTLAGYAGVTIWPGALSWPLVREVELFLAVAVPVGIADLLAKANTGLWRIMEEIDAGVSIAALGVSVYEILSES